MLRIRTRQRFPRSRPFEKVDEEKLEEIIDCAGIDRRVEAVNLIEKGLRNTLYRVELEGDGGDIAVRVCIENDGANDAVLNAIAARKGVRVPRIHDFIPRGPIIDKDVLVMEWIWGDTLAEYLSAATDKGLEMVGVDLADNVLRMQKASITSHGRLRRGALVCKFDSWCSMANEIVNKLAVLPWEVLQAKQWQIEMLRREVWRVGGVLREMPSVLVHSDLHAENMMITSVRGKPKTVLIDFCNGMFSCAAVEIAKLEGDLFRSWPSLAEAFRYRYKKKSCYPHLSPADLDLLYFIDVAEFYIDFANRFDASRPNHPERRASFLELWNSTLDCIRSAA